MKLRKFECLQAEPCMHYRTGHVIDNTSLIGNVDRMENCNPAKIESIVGVIRAILNEEVNRKGPFVGLNIYQDERFPTRVFYGRSYGNDFDEFGSIPTSHFLDFETPDEAAAYVAILQGILMMGLARFKVNAEQFTYRASDEAIELPVIEEPPREVIEQGYSAYDYFVKK